MTKIFNCPSCGAPIDYDGGPDPTIRCKFCNNVVIVPPELRTDTPSDSEPEPAETELRTVGQMPQWAEIGRLVKQGNKIEAIKLFRQLTGAGLKESKDAIEKLEAGRALEVANYAVVLTPQNVPEVEIDRAAQIQKIGQLLRQGNKIEAIKQYRLVFGVGLKEAKDAIDRLESTADTPGAFDIHPPEVKNVSYSPARAAGTSTATGLPSGVIIAGLILGVAALIFSCYSLAIMDEYDTWDISVVFRGTATYTPEAEEEAEATRAASPPTSAPTIAPPPTFTPEFADMGILVSWSGTGPGELNDANTIGVDGEGHIYVGENDSGRVQVFNAQGEFLEQWRIEQGEESLRKMAVARDGTVYIVANGNIYKYAGLTGKLLGQVEYSGGQGFQDVAVTADDGLAASWNRDWRGGLFTNFNESQDDIVIFDREGNVALVIAKALSEAASGDPELDTLIAVDAEGNIYATGSLNSGIFKFSPQGKFVDKYVDERLNFILDMVVDDRGRLFVAAAGDILVFDENGGYVDVIDASPTGLVFADDGTLFVVDDPQILTFGINR